MNPPMPFVDLEAQYRRISVEVDEAIRGVLTHGRFIMGPEVAQLETELAEFCGSRYTVTCSSGTDALLMVLMAWNVGPGDAVFLPSFTFASTAEVVALLGATPWFVDVDEGTFNVDVESLRWALEASVGSNLRPAAAIGVDLFGLPADWTSLKAAAEEYRIKLLADAAQSFGGSTPEGRVGTLADATVTSFFPAKPLGCYGDGGAIFTDSGDLKEILTSIRVHGQGENKYDNVRVGINGRLDTIQAAILLEKLKIFEDELERRDEAAQRYASMLSSFVGVPVIPDGYRSAWAQYTVRSARRDELREMLRVAGVPTAIYYPKPLHLQAPFAAAPLAPDGLPVTSTLAREVFSLPMHPYLSMEDQKRVTDLLLEPAR